MTLTRLATPLERYRYSSFEDAPGHHWRPSSEERFGFDELEPRRVTICIAAICAMPDGNQGIVLCTDWRGSSFVGFSDTMLKERRIGPYWRCLTAGRESDILGLYNALWPRFGPGVDLSEVTTPGIVRQAVEARKLEKADDLIRGMYGLTWKEFLATGKEQFPPDLFREGIERVRSIDLGTDFILAGFDPKFPMLITVGSDCKVQVRDELAVVGEGQFLAQASLVGRSYSSAMVLSEALYFVFEAKRAAERVTSVGEGTRVLVLSKNRKYELTEDGERQLNALYAEHGPRPRPEISLGDSALNETET